MQRILALHPDAQTDLVDVWELVRRNDGAQRADKVLARIEVFLRRLEEFPHIGSRHEEQRPGLRSCGVPGLKGAVVVFQVTTRHTVVLRVGYLGRDVVNALP